MDEVAIFSNTWEENLKHLGLVLDRIWKANLTIKRLKCKFAQNHIEYLRHVEETAFTRWSENRKCRKTSYTAN